MLSTVEKVLALKSVDLFARLSGEDLAGIAAICRYSAFEEGETVFDEGQLGDALYVVLEGRVRVHREERTVAEIGEGECFGEMALLDSAPRSASVTALCDTTCLRIDRDDFSDILTEKPQIAQGVIRVLTRRLRSSLDRPLEEAGP